MTKAKKIGLRIGLIVSIPAGLYAAGSVIFYAWLSAAEPERWPPDRASVWVSVSALLTVLFLGIFIYCLVALIKQMNKEYREGANGT